MEDDAIYVAWNCQKQLKSTHVDPITTQAQVT